VVSPPKLIFADPDNMLLDAEAIQDSITLDGVLLSREQLWKDFELLIGSSYVRIRSKIREMPKNPQSLKIVADTYNQKKTTKYRLPRDITLAYTDIPKDLSFNAEGDPRDQKYNITLYGLGEYTPNEIRYYAHHEASADCSISSW
jgi:hypothetical protein